MSGKPRKRSARAPSYPLKLRPETVARIREARALECLYTGRERVTFCEMLGLLAKNRIRMIRRELWKKGFTTEQINEHVRASGVEVSGAHVRYQDRKAAGEFAKRAGETPPPPVVD